MRSEVYESSARLSTKLLEAELHPRNCTRCGCTESEHKKGELDRPLSKGMAAYRTHTATLEKEKALATCLNLGGFLHKVRTALMS